MSENPKKILSDSPDSTWVGLILVILTSWHKSDEMKGIILPELAAKNNIVHIKREAPL